MSVSLLQIVGHMSFGLTAVSFYVRDMLLLRSLAIGAGLVGLVYNYLVPGGPLWLVIFWICVFMAINLARIGHLIWERRQVRFSDEEQELYGTLFRQFSPVEFMKLLRLGRWVDAAPGDTLAIQDEPVAEVKLIYNGEVEVERDGTVVATSRDGAMIGEISFLQGGPATATVRVLRPTRYVAWGQEDLRRMMRRNPTMDVALRTVFSLDLTRKLTGAVATAG